MTLCQKHAAYLSPKDLDRFCPQCLIEREHRGQAALDRAAEPAEDATLRLVDLSMRQIELARHELAKRADRIAQLERFIDSAGLPVPGKLKAVDDRWIPWSPPAADEGG